MSKWLSSVLPLPILFSASALTADQRGESICCEDPHQAIVVTYSMPSGGRTLWFAVGPVGTGVVGVDTEASAIFGAAGRNAGWTDG